MNTHSMNLHNAKRGADQLGLFQSDAALMASIISLPKVELHRHLTGSITAETAVRVAAKHNIEMPSFLARELEKVLFPTDTVETHEEYFTPWEILNKLFASLDAVRDILTYVIRDSARDNIVYQELRLGPRGFLGDSAYSFDEFIQCVAEACRKADERFRVTTRCVLGVPRHVFVRMRADTRERMLSKMLYSIREFPDCFVGVDLNGDELAASGVEFEPFFNLANKFGLGITVHAGEVATDATEIAYAVNCLFASRIGHGVAAASSVDTLELLHSRQTMLEFCPTSNEMLGVIRNTEGLPIRTLEDHGIPFAICTDNPARCRTVLSEELFKVAKAFSFDTAQLTRLQLSALNAAFAAEGVKDDVRRKIGVK
jgi:adenosine deaminase